MKSAWSGVASGHESPDGSRYSHVISSESLSDGAVVGVGAATFTTVGGTTVGGGVASRKMTTSRNKLLALPSDSPCQTASEAGFRSRKTIVSGGTASVESITRRV